MKGIRFLWIVLFTLTGLPNPGGAQALTPRQVVALADSGHGEAAELAATTAGIGQRTVLADLLVRRGLDDSARVLYRSVLNAGMPGARSAQAGLAELAAERGDREGSWKEAVALTDAYQRARGGEDWSSDDVTSAGRAYVLLSLGDPGATRAALSAFDKAVTRDPDNIEAMLRTGDLFLSKYNFPDARESYLEVLKKAPRNSRALFGMARTVIFQGHPDATAAVGLALQENPQLAPAWVALGKLHLEAEAYDSALNAAKRALAIDSTSAAIWGLNGAVAWIQDDTARYRRSEAAAHRWQPGSAEFYLTVGDAAARGRRYAEAIAMARRALSVDSLSTGALDLLAVNLLRQGFMDEGRVTLERSFALDAFNLWNDNTLKLLDLLQTYRTVKTPRFEIITSPGEADYLALYLGPLLERAYDELARRYDYQPPVPIRVELYERHAEFSVRTVAMPGLGALGVSFGPVIVLDSPKARDKGAFNYGSTSWHELTHTFTLGASGFRVPRWISEGLSVLEERRQGNGWGANVSSDFLAAWKGGFLPPVSRMNDGLVRPAYPMQIMHTYYQASLFCEMVEEMKGLEGIRAILHGFRDGEESSRILQKVLGVSPVGLDTLFHAWVERRFATPLAALSPGSTGADSALGRYVSAVAQGVGEYQQGDGRAARVSLLRADSLWPGYGGEDGPARWLSRIALDQADTAEAIRQLARVTNSVEDALELNQVEAQLRFATGDIVGGLAAAERIQWIAPYEVDRHIQTAIQYEGLREWPKAIRERRAVVALNPADLIEARYQLARVLAESGDKVEARREIMEVLEMSPAFEKAQILLLRLRQGGQQ